MQHSKCTVIDLKFRLVLGFLFLTFQTLFSQSFILKGRAVHKDDKPISGAVVYKNNLNTKVLTNNEGIFFLNVSSLDTINVVSKGSNDYFIVPERTLDTLDYVFILTTKSFLIDEVVVSSKRIEKISGDYNEYMLDYYVFENGSIAMLKNYKNIHYLTFQNELKEKVDYELPFVPVEFYLDCVGNMHIVSKDSTYQFWIDTTFHIVQVLSNKYVKANLKSLVYCGEKEYVYFDISDYNRKYRLNLRDENSTTTFMEVFDSIGYNDIKEQLENLQSERCQPGKTCTHIYGGTHFARSLPQNQQSATSSQNYGGSTYGTKEANYRAYANIKNYSNYKMQYRSTSINYPSNRISSASFNSEAFIQHQINVPIKIQSFSINQSIISIDLSNDNLKVFNLKGKEIHSAHINQNDHSKNEIIKDPYGKKFYLSNNNNYSSTLEISSLNVQNGEHTAILSLKEVRFPEKVKIFNGELFFVAANENGFQKLYSLNLFLGE